MEQQLADSKAEEEAAAKEEGGGVAVEVAAAAGSEGGSNSEGEGGGIGSKGVVTPTKRSAANKITQTGMGATAAEMSVSAQAEAGSGASTPLDTVAMLLGSPEGATLRRIALDLDSTELLLKLGSQEARDIRRMGVEALATKLTPKLRLPPPSRVLNAVVALPTAAARRLRTLSVEDSKYHPFAPGGKYGEEVMEEAEEVMRSEDEEAAVSGGKGRRWLRPALPKEWPMSGKSLQQRRRKAMRTVAVATLLLRSHLNRQLSNGWRGVAAMGTLLFVALRVAFPAVLKAFVRSGSAVTAITALLTTALATVRANRGAALFALIVSGVLGFGYFVDRKGPQAPPGKGAM